MNRSPLWQLPALLALLLPASCSAEMPVPDGQEVTPRTTHRRALPPQQVPRRLGSLWASLPHAAATRAGEDPTPDSLFTVPSGDFVGTYEPGTDAWMQNPDIDQIDTLSTYGYVVTFKEQPGYVIHFRVRTYKDGKTERVEKTELVHCNWGWCGNHNGYAVAYVFDPYENFAVPPEWMETRSQSATAYCRKTKMYTNITPR